MLSRKIVIFFLVLGCFSQLFAQHNFELYNEGELIHIQAGAEVHVWGDQHQMGNGTLENNGLVKVQGHAYSSNTFQQRGTGTFNIANSDVNVGERQMISGSYAVRGGSAQIGVDDGSFYNLELENDQGIVYLVGAGNIADVRNSVDFSSGGIDNRIVTHDIGATGIVIYPLNGSLYSSTFGMMNSTPGLGNMTNNTVTLNGNMSGSDVGYVQGNFRRAIAPAGGTYNYVVGLEPAGAGAAGGMQYINLTLGANAYDVIDCYFQRGLSNVFVSPNECSGYGIDYFGGVDHGQWVFGDNVGATENYSVQMWPQDDNFPASTVWMITKDNNIAGTANECGASPVGLARSAFSGTGIFGVAAGTIFGLPIELLSFNGSCVKGDVLLEWSTASEVNNSYFIIEESTDGENFTELGRVTGAGNSSSTNIYNFSPDSKGQMFYRLSQVDFDGTLVQFDLISVKCAEMGQSEVVAYPNPTNGNLQVEIIGEEDERWTLFLMDYAGKLIKQREVQGNQLVEFNLVNYATGMYMLRATSDNQVISKKIVKH